MSAHRVLTSGRFRNSWILDLAFWLAWPVAPLVAQDLKPPGLVIDYSPAASQQYIGSPSLVVLSNGEYVASHDLFGPGSTGDCTRIFRSRDRGATWTKLTELQGQWWSTLFLQQGSLYILGTTRENGFVVIRRSTDGGQAWTTPRDRNSGLLLDDGGYHCAPVPVVVHAGRLWRAMEDTRGPEGAGIRLRAFMLSAPVEADLLKASSWTASSRRAKNPAWLDHRFGGWLEGNAVVTPQGDIVDVLRVDSADPDEKAAIVRIGRDGKEATFDPQTDFIDFPGGCKKFTIRFDPVSNKYWSLANYVPPRQQRGSPALTRNTLALTCSSDLRHWTVQSIVLSHPDPEKHAFQYVDWQFEGEDMIAVSRTAFDDDRGGAHNQHDANYLTFHRFNNFRRLSAKNSGQRP
jgi:hypothetical protein